MARSSIGVDIGTRAVGVAEVQPSGHGFQVTRFGRALLPTGAVDHGEVHDPQAVANVITGLFKKLGLTGREVHIGISNRRVVVRTIELPAMSREDLAGAIRFQAQEAIPIPLDEAVMDYEVIDEIDGVDGEKLQRVLVVAAERGTVQNLLSAVQLAKLDIATLELDAYPLVRCFRSNDPDKAEAIVDIGAGVTNVVVHQGGKIRFTRILPTFGGDEFTVAVAQALGIGHDEAEALKRQASALLRDRASRHAIPVAAASAVATSRVPRRPVAREAVAGGSEVADVPIPGSYQPYAVEAEEMTETTSESFEQTPQTTPAGRAAEIMEPILDRFVSEIRGSLDFYASQPDAPAIDRVVMTGGGSLMGGIIEQLEATLGLPVEMGHPLELVPLGKLDVSPEERAIAEPFIAVSVGLALAGTGA